MCKIGGQQSVETHSIVALLEDLMGQQFQRATIDSRLCSQVALDGMVGFTTISGTSMENHFPLDGTGLRIPDEQRSRDKNSH